MSLMSRSVVAAVTGPLLLLSLPGTGPPDGTSVPRAGPPDGISVSRASPSPHAPVAEAAVGPSGSTAPREAAGGAPRPDVGEVAASLAAGGAVSPPVAGARGPRPDAGTVHPRWRWPLVPRPAVLRPFRAPAGPYGPGHRGTDLGADTGAGVLAVEDGVVTHAGRVAGRGTVTVLHAGGLSSTYEPVRAAVVAGTQVDAGDLLGSVEPPAVGPPAGHCVLAVCLHLGARQGTSYVDPVLLLVGGRVRLLPLGAGQPTTG